MRTDPARFKITVAAVIGHWVWFPDNNSGKIRRRLSLKLLKTSTPQAAGAGARSAGPGASPPAPAAAVASRPGQQRRDSARLFRLNSRPDASRPCPLRWPLLPAGSRLVVRYRPPHRGSASPGIRSAAARVGWWCRRRRRRSTRLARPWRPPGLVFPLSRGARRPLWIRGWQLGLVTGLGVGFYSVGSHQLRN